MTMIGLFSLFLGVASAADVEVSPGDDLSQLTGSLAPGDVITFNDGTYVLETGIAWTGIGTADSPITLQAAAGASPVLELSVPEGGSASYIVYIYDAAYMNIKGLSFVGGDGWESLTFRGVQIEDSTAITFDDCEIGQTGSTALYLYGDDSEISVTNTHIHDTINGYGAYVGCSDAACWTSNSTFSNNWFHDIGGDGSYIFYLAAGGQGNTISDNVMYQCPYRGLSVHSTEFGEPNVVEGNVIWNVSNIGLYVRGASIVRNNVVFNVDGYGLYSEDNGRGSFSDLVISSNTFANTTNYAAYLLDWPWAEGNVFANNAVCNPTGYGLFYEAAPDTGVTDGSYLSSNVICGLVMGFDEGASVPGAGFDDFADVEGWDFYPTTGSHLRDSGDPSGEAWVPDTDFNGTARDGAAPDAGAYEWTGAANPGWAIQEDFKDLEATSSGAGAEVGGCCSKKGAAEAALFVPLALGASLRRRRRAERGSDAR